MQYDKEVFFPKCISKNITHIEITNGSETDKWSVLIYFSSRVRGGSSGTRKATQQRVGLAPVHNPYATPG